MRKLLALLVVCLGFAGISSLRAAHNSDMTQPMENVASKDSTIAVIGWFVNHDTLNYCIQDSWWKIVPHDTIMTQGVTTRVMITVEDSTATGYKMKYTILDVQGDTVPTGIYREGQNILVKLMNKSVVGNSIQFETDEFGHIIKFDDLSKLKKKAKSIFNEGVKELENLPMMKDVKKIGFDVRKITKGISMERILDGYLLDINLLFMYHGLEFELGETTSHEDATETQYENESITVVGKMDTGLYYIESETVSLIPVEDVKAIVAGVYGLSGNKELAEVAKDEAEVSIFDDGIKDSYFKIEYIPEGWPFTVLKEETTMLGNHGTVKQKYIFFTTPFTLEK